MPVDATVAGANANSFGTVTEADDYFLEQRLPLPTLQWDSFEDKDIALIMATRAIIAYFKASRRLIVQGGRTGYTNSGGIPVSYYLTGRTWLGTPATTTQKLPFPRVGLYDANGNAIPSNVIPIELKEAEFELAGRMGQADLTLDNDIAVQGISKVKVGSVDISFRDSVVAMKLIPEYVLDLLPASWLTDELIEPAFLSEINFL